MTNITQEDILKINNYFKDELLKINPNIEVLTYRAPNRIKGYDTPKLILPNIIKDKIKNQEKGKEYTYILNNEEEVLDRNIQIVISNGQNHVVFETYQALRLTYFDSQFKELGNISHERVTGENFDSIQGLQFKFVFSTPYCKTVKIDVSPEDPNYFYISSMGKNRIKSIYFNNDKKQIDVEFSNSFIKEINLDLEGNLKHICMKRNISRELTLKKYHFNVDSYSSFMKSIESELDLHNLKTDGDIDFMDTKSFEERIDFIKNVINEKNNMVQENIYPNLSNITKTFNLLYEEINDNSIIAKEKVEDHNYYYPHRVLNYILRLKKHNYSFDKVASPEVLDSYNNLTNLSQHIKNAFKKVTLEDKKQTKKL